jgi:hypothetical protein
VARHRLVERGDQSRLELGVLLAQELDGEMQPLHRRPAHVWRGRAERRRGRVERVAQIGREIDGEEESHVYRIRWIVLDTSLTQQFAIRGAVRDRRAA